MSSGYGNLNNHIGVPLTILGLKNEDKFIGSGISYCATCDGNFYKDKVVAVVGGGNVAMDAARTALRLGAETTIVRLTSVEDKAENK